MNTNDVRAAIYLRASRDDQTTENQRSALVRCGSGTVQRLKRGNICGEGGVKGHRVSPGLSAQHLTSCRRRREPRAVAKLRP
jgi:hypothetical protein